MKNSTKIDVVCTKALIYTVKGNTSKKKAVRRDCTANKLLSIWVSKVQIVPDAAAYKQRRIRVGIFRCSLWGFCS